MPETDITQAYFSMEQQEGLSEQSFEAAFKSHFKALHAYAYTILRDSEDAEEIVQQVFLKLWERHESITINQSLKSYLYRSVYHDSLNFLKHNKVKHAHQQHVQHQGEPKEAEAASGMAARELQQKIVEGLQLLPEQCRTIFQMSRFEDLKYREIADRLGLSVKTIENQMGKALKVMRLHLSAYLTVLIIVGITFLIKLFAL